MAKIEFGTEVGQLQRDGFDLARADEPDFDLARWHLKTARDVVYTSSIRLKSDIFYSIVARDLGIIDVREGLYLYDKKASLRTRLWATLIRVLLQSDYLMTV